ncbi:hypothetical protein ACN47E_000485 [Coniothyrium glycines]
MVSRLTSEAHTTPQPPLAPVVKRKRRTSCLGEHERRERKRAIDREAQRSLREKTKTHIAELERTIQILRDQDHNGATANLLTEIDMLRTENERLKEIIDSVKNLVSIDLFPCNTAPASGLSNANAPISPAGSSTGQRSPELRTVSSTIDTKPVLPSPPLEAAKPCESTPVNVCRPLDLDGMTLVHDVAPAKTPAPAPAQAPISEVRMSDEYEAVAEEVEVDEDEAPWEKNPNTAMWTPMMEEIFGPNWRSPDPVVLHIESPDETSSLSSSSTTATAAAESTTSTKRKLKGELLGKVFNCRSGNVEMRSAKALEDSRPDVVMAAA